MSYYNKLPIIDLHSDYVMACYDVGKRFKSSKQTNLKLLKKNNVKIILAGFSYDDYFGDTDRQLEILLAENIKNNDFNLILTRKDFNETLKSKTKTGFILHLEGGGILKNDINKFYQLYEKGLRSIGLTHSSKNCLASGNKENPKDHITSFGKKIIKEAIKKKIIIDLAHLNRQGFYDVAKLVDKPLLVSHANAYHLCPDPRNLADDQIKLVAKTRGVIGIFFSAKYINKNKKPTIDDVVEHFVYIANIAGVDVLALGSDFGGITTGLPSGLENVGKLNRLLEKLKNRGFSQSDIEKISYKNAKRVIEAYLS